MARAKRTDRADARRRWRRTQTGELESPDEIRPASTATPRAAAGPAQRPSITAAFRNAYHRANVREDIAALPWLLRSRAFLISVALVVGGTAAMAVAPSAISFMLFNALVLPPAMAPIFIVGFFARRASYLLGLFISVVAVAGFAIYTYGIEPSLATKPVDPVLQQQAIFSAITVGPVSGIFFAAAAAWYRRFLSLSNAGAQQRARARQQGKPRASRPARG